MFSKWILLIVLFNFVLKANFECSVEDDKSREVRGISFLDAVRTVVAKIKKIFSKPHPNPQSLKPKSEFAQFLDEYLRRKQTSQGMESVLRLGARKTPVGFLLPLDTRPEMNAEQLIAAHGYLSESHTVITKDGYLLTMHRVLREFGFSNERVVMLHHGILGSSEDWLLLGANRALPYMLIEHGYDVWLLNARGNRYSRVHARKSVEFPDFWDFSWHEMGVYDLPAAIEYISDVTKSLELNFIGHSMGATALLVLLSTKPEYNDILNSATLLAPLAYMYHARGPITMLAKFYRENGHRSLSFLGKTEFMRHDVFPEQVIQKYCKADNKSCFNPLLLFGNGGSGLWGTKIMEDVLAHVPAGGSVKSVMHYVQLVNSGYFQMYDYGVDGNHRRYKSGGPTLYNLGAITLPVALFSSTSDWLATHADVQTMLPQLQAVPIHHVIRDDDFGHFDFVWSPNANLLIYNYIIPLLNQNITK